MKKYFYLCLITLGCMLTFSACGSDDDPTLEDLEQAAEQGRGTLDASLQDMGNQLIIDYTATVLGYKSTTHGVYTFDGSSDDSKCISVIMTETYPNANVAQSVFNQESDEEKAAGTVKLNGNQVIYDYTKDFKGMPKAEVKWILEEEIKHIKDEMNRQ